MPEKTIPITTVQIGHIVGPGGANIKRIQQQSGAKVAIDNDGPVVKISAEEQSQVDVAEAAIKKVIASQENPDYEGPEGTRLRKEANALGDKRSKLFDEATAKRNAGDHAGANKLVAEAKQAGEEMEARHREAAAAIAKHNNEDKGKGEDYFDMHGLREEEAMEMLKIRTAVLEAKPSNTVTDFEVIPGAGHHSAPGAQKLKGATEAYFKEKGFTYGNASAGTIIVKVPGGGTASQVHNTQIRGGAAQIVEEEEAIRQQEEAEMSEPKVFVRMPAEVRERSSQRGRRSRGPTGTRATVGADAADADQVSSRVFVRMPAETREKRSRSRDGRASAGPRATAAPPSTHPTGDNVMPSAAQASVGRVEDDAAVPADDKAAASERTTEVEDVQSRETADAEPAAARESQEKANAQDEMKSGAAEAAEDHEPVAEAHEESLEELDIPKEDKKDDAKDAATGSEKKNHKKKKSKKDKCGCCNTM